MTSLSKDNSVGASSDHSSGPAILSTAELLSQSQHFSPGLEAIDFVSYLSLSGKDIVYLSSNDDALSLCQSILCGVGLLKDFFTKNLLEHKGQAEGEVSKLDTFLEWLGSTIKDLQQRFAAFSPSETYDTETIRNFLSFYNSLILQLNAFIEHELVQKLLSDNLESTDSGSLQETLQSLLFPLPTARFTQNADLLRTLQ